MGNDVAVIARMWERTPRSGTRQNLERYRRPYRVVGACIVRPSPRGYLVGARDQRRQLDRYLDQLTTFPVRNHRLSRRQHLHDGYRSIVKKVKCQHGCRMGAKALQFGDNAKLVMRLLLKEGERS